MFGRPSSASAQDLSGLSVCIDPGHGRGNTNQGPTGLREADINLSVSFFLKDFLKRANIDTVLLTRVDDSTNPTLSQREAIANTFGVD
ncbi:N-acetylmuramoyl-L-alanine amidase, partial [candidate division KSB1 bacterium]|nr:N-acetylmuramoyl-L-alanine amidase [candidate division KSB1 bacterium]NIR71931.1 N-acetylmuramoyl-L-alanine amidase [candidate division KSB1 bacterium]NIS24933.1 N-acetylmuramoyl-L-alanine amidase [candidate division KSB1 bacterium]NIT71851.1 N-acetylmuramoyl-L-alanine amidase [candidate division KSB1 bacterium]NIU25589.1 N-acetylmuramoyl-L-alanine amidase [candidate division KSB1 bacterium]